METCPYLGYNDVKAGSNLIKRYTVCMGQKYMPIVECEGNPDSEYCEPQKLARARSKESSETIEWPLRAKWVGKNVHGAWFYECGNCGEPKPPMGKNKYCNGCGALMEEEK